MVNGAPQVKSGKLRGLGVTSRKRDPLLPEVQAIAETVKDFELIAWFAMFAPAGIPKAVEAKLSGALKATLEDKEVAMLMERGGTIPRWLAPDDLVAQMDKDTARWADVIKQAGIKAE